METCTFEACVSAQTVNTWLQGQKTSRSGWVIFVFFRDTSFAYIRHNRFGISRRGASVTSLQDTTKTSTLWTSRGTADTLSPAVVTAPYASGISTRTARSSTSALRMGSQQLQFPLVLSTSPPAPWTKVFACGMHALGC